MRYAVRSLRLLTGFIGCGLLLAGLPAHADIITTLDGIGADTFVQGTDSVSPTPINFGSATGLTIKNPIAPNRFARKPYLRFDLSTLTLEVVDVSLDLVVQQNNMGGTGGSTTPTNFTVNVYGLNDGHAGEDWIEGNGGTDNDPPGEIVWINAPGNDTSSGIDFLASETTLLGSFDVTALDIVGSTVSFSSSALVDFIKADTNDRVTLMLARPEGGSKNLAFYSKEYSGGVNVPQLDITVIPEPGTMALAGVGFLLIRLLCRRA